MTSPFRIEDLTRREFISSALAAAFLIACGDDDDEPESTGASDARFPARVTHKYGTTEIARAPQRVLSLGYSDHDALLALDVQPIAVRYWYSDEPVFPWAQARLQGEQPPSLEMPAREIDFEAITALSPDLIVAVYAGISEEDYGRLSQIAPTVVHSGEFNDFAMPWEETTIHIGRAFGREAEARQLVANVETKIAAIRNEHPEFVGAKAVVAQVVENGAFFYSSEDLRSRTISALGFEVPEEVAELFGDIVYAEVSNEQIALLDNADLIVWRNERSMVEAREIYWTLDVAKEGRHVFLEDLEMPAAAFGFSTVLSLPYFLDAVVPLLEAAMDGDPTTN